MPEQLIEANAEQRYEVTDDNLPLSCPMPNMTLWNSHPRVYLPIEKTGEASCPYCGAKFFLKNFNEGRAERAETPGPV